MYAGATTAAVVFLVFVYLLFTELQFVPIFLSVLFCGLFANAAAPITLELASELTFPVGEETSATVLVVLFSVIQLAFIEFSDMLSPEVMNWVNAGVLGVATIGLLLVPAWWCGVCFCIWFIRSVLDVRLQLAAREVQQAGGGSVMV